MTRVKNIGRFVGTIVAVWTVAGADWPMDDLVAFIGGIRCC